MQLTVPPDLEGLIHKRIASGAYATAEEVLRGALEAQDFEESLSDEARIALTAHIEEGYRQAVRGELMDSAQAIEELQAKKAAWHLNRQ